MNKYIDSHAHYNARQFNKNRPELLKELTTSLELIVNCGTNTKSNKDVLKLSEEYDFLYSVIGFFPHDVLELEDKNILNTFLEQLEHNKVLGVGEIGLDYYHSKVDRDNQINFFNLQIDIANNYNLPVCIHSREAKEDTLDVIRNKNLKEGIIHCYSYDLKTAKELEDRGFYFGIGGTSTYKNNAELRKVIKEISIHNILLETDAPYLSPQQKRGEINNSKYIQYVIENISDIKDIDLNDVVNITNNNFKRAYKI